MLAHEMRELADSQHDKIKETYEKILRDIKERAKNGFYSLVAYYWLKGIDVDAICEQLKAEGFEVHCEYDGFSYLAKFSISWNWSR